jgi:hypothetical protein
MGDEVLAPSARTRLHQRAQLVLLQRNVQVDPASMQLHQRQRLGDLRVWADLPVAQGHRRHGIAHGTVTPDSQSR